MALTSALTHTASGKRPSTPALSRLWRVKRSIYECCSSMYKQPFQGSKLGIFRWLQKIYYKCNRNSLKIKAISGTPFAKEGLRLVSCNNRVKNRDLEFFQAPVFCVIKLKSHFLSSCSPRPLRFGMVTDAHYADRRCATTTPS